MALLTRVSEWEKNNMAEKNYNIPKEKFTFVHQGERISDKKFEDKPIGYFRDAWIRFRKSRAAVVAAIIIVCIILYSFLAPLLITSHDATFMCGTYAKKPGRVTWLRDFGIATGGVKRNNNEAGYIKLLAVGVAAEGQDGNVIALGEAANSAFQPVLDTDEPYEQILPGNKKTTYYPAKVDTYLEVGFIYTSVEQPEYQKMLKWQEETGKQLIYPLVDTENGYCFDKEDANFWYKTKISGSGKGMPVQVNGEKVTTLKYSEDLILEDNYKRDADGNVLYYEFVGGGNVDTAQYKVRVLYYNYYQYLYGSEPNYIMGTDAQGYDLALRIAGGIQLSLLVAICVSVINFLIGAAYGATEGYYGGAVDLIMERITDILGGIPFIVVATLFQIHLAKKVGPIPSLLFAYVLTGWMGTSYRVRTQFYRFKNQEYVMAARTLGARDRRIIWKHIFPNTLGTIITSSALVIPGVILTESMLSFLGIIKLGTAEQTSLGTLLSDASSIWTNYPHLMLYPALIISLLMICFNLFGNGLRDAFNPALRGVED